MVGDESRLVADALTNRTLFLAELFAVGECREGSSRAETQVPKCLGDEFVACGYPIFAVEAMRAAACLVLLVSTLGDIRIASSF